MGLKNKHYRQLGEFAVYGPDDESRFVPLGWEFEFMMTELDLNTQQLPPIPPEERHDRWGTPALYTHQQTQYIRNKFSNDLFKFGGDCGLEVASFVAPLSTHKAWLTKNKFDDLPHSSTASGAGTHIAIGCNDYTNPIKDKLFTFLNVNTPFSELQRISGRTMNHFEMNCGPSSRSGPWNARHDNARRLINDAHDIGGGRCRVQQNAEPKRMFLRFSTSGRQIGQMATPVPWGKGWWELRMFHGRRQYLRPALEFADAIVRIAHEPEPMSIGLLYEYVRAFPRYRELSELMASELDTCRNVKGRSKYAPTIRRRTRTERSRSGDNVSIGRGSQSSAAPESAASSATLSSFIDPVFRRISLVLSGRDPDEGEEGQAAA